MRKSVQLFTIMLALATLLAGNITASASDNVFGVEIEQRALEILTAMSQRLAEVRGAADLKQVISIKAKIVVADVIQSGELTEHIPKMVFWVKMEIFKSRPDRVRVNLSSNFGELQFLTMGSDGAFALAILPEDRVFAKMNIPQMLPASIILPEDDGGLFTMINLLGGVPFGSLFRHPSTDGGIVVPPIGFVEELNPADRRAVIRYRGRSKCDGGIVHIITVGSVLNKQYIKIWVLLDTLDLYQISIEDERGTEVFVVIDELNTSPAPSQANFALDTSNLMEVSEEEFLTRFMWKIVSSPITQRPVAVDLWASSDRVARTGMLTISTDGFDLQDSENKLICEVEYKSESSSGKWIPLKTTEYAGLAPLGRWNAIFAADDAAELGAYSFRVRYIDSSGNISEWLEALDLVTVTPAPPRVVQTKPVPFEVGVSVSTEIAITFSKPMDKTSVEKAFSVVSESGRVIRGSFAWEDTAKAFTFSPSYDLEYDTRHLVRITGAARDIDSISLDGNGDGVSSGIPFDDYIWTFKTSVTRPAFTFLPKERPIYKGNIFHVRIMAKFVTEMYKFSFKVAFDPQVLKAESVDVASFTSWRPRTKYAQELDLWSKPMIDNSAGFVTISCDGTRTNGVTGTGLMCTISFEAADAGKATLEFREVSVLDSKGRRIYVEQNPAEVQVMEFHPLDTNHDGVVDIRDFVTAASEGEDFEANAPAAPRLVCFELGQNYPNPFNPETWIPYQLAQTSYVTIRIYDSTGRLVRTLDLSRKEAGFYYERTKAAYWDGIADSGQKVSSGVYFYTIQTDGFTATKKMLLRE